VSRDTVSTMLRNTVSGSGRTRSSSYLSVHQSSCKSSRTPEQVFMKYDNGEFTRQCWHISILVKIRQK
jgi:hypothetical protein